MVPTTLVSCNRTLYILIDDGRLNHSPAYVLYIYDKLCFEMLISQMQWVYNTVQCLLYLTIQCQRSRVSHRVRTGSTGTIP